MPANESQLENLKNLLLHFSAYTGLGVNFQKSIMVPINTLQHKMEILANNLGCDIGYFPFTYMGLPLTLTKPRLEDFAPILKRIDKRLMGCSTLLSYGDKLVLIKVVFTSLPTFFMSTLALPAGILEQINKYLRSCFWRKYGMKNRGSALISWDKVCLPKDRGGLGVLNLAIHNKCLLMKHIHKFFSSDLHWVNLIWSSYYPDGTFTRRQQGSFWWKAISKLIPEFKQQAQGIIGQGNTISFW